MLTETQLGSRMLDLKRWEDNKSKYEFCKTNMRIARRYLFLLKSLPITGLIDLAAELKISTTTLSNNMGIFISVKWVDREVIPRGNGQWPLIKFFLTDLGEEKLASL